MCQSKAEGGRRCPSCQRSYLAKGWGRYTSNGDIAWSMDREVSRIRSLGEVAPHTAAAVKHSMTSARRTEKVSTPVLESVVEQAGGGARLAGRDHRIKSPTSLARKVQTKQTKTGQTAAKVCDSLSDTVRYTVVGDNDDLVRTCTDSVTRLRDEGYAVTSVEHSYVEGNNYKGLHVTLRSPQGCGMEVQFHTEDSLRIKSSNHLLYEQARELSTPPGEVDRLNQAMRDAFADVPAPKGLDTLSAALGHEVVTKIRS